MAISDHILYLFIWLFSNNHWHWRKWWHWFSVSQSSSLLETEGWTSCHHGHWCSETGFCLGLRFAVFNSESAFFNLNSSGPNSSLYKIHFLQEMIKSGSGVGHVTRTSPPTVTLPRLKVVLSIHTKIYITCCLHASPMANGMTITWVQHDCHMHKAWPSNYTGFA